jgi:hypothetical protein
MLDKVTKKAYHTLKVPDTLGVIHDIKVLNFLASGTRTHKLDRQCIVDKDSSLKPGMMLVLPDGKIIIVSHKQADIYKTDIIRYTLDCIECTHLVDIRRTELVKSTQGGLAGQIDSIVYHAVPVKVALTDYMNSKIIDNSTPKFVMFYSYLFELHIGDRITLSDSTFEEAKVNSLVHITPGLMEVHFDKDPRWL